MESLTQQTQSQASLETPVESPAINEEAQKAERSLAVLPVLHELYPLLRWSWLLFTPQRTSNRRLEEIWLPFIVDNAVCMPLENGGICWKRPLGSPIPLLGSPTIDPRSEYQLGLPMEPSHCQQIIKCLFLNPNVERFFCLILNVESQHDELTNASVWNCTEYLAPFTGEKWDEWMDAHAFVDGGRPESQQRQHPPNQVSETASPNPDATLLSTGMPIIELDDTSDEETHQSAWRNLERLDAQAKAAFQVIEENGEAIRNELRANLDRMGRSEWFPYREEPQRMVTDSGPGEGNAPQIPEPSHVPDVDNGQQSHESPLEPRSEPEDNNDQYSRTHNHVPHIPTHLQRRGAMSQRGSQDIQQPSMRSPNPLMQQAPVVEPLGGRAPNPLLQGVPVIRPRGENRPDTPVEQVHYILETPSLSLWEAIGRKGKSQTTTYGSAVMQLNYRIRNVQALQKELSQILDCVSKRSGTLVDYATKRFKTLMPEEYRRMHGCRTNVAPFHTEMHLASLRESIIVINREICPKAETMSKVNQLEIWFRSLRSDLIFAARLYGKNTPIKHGWSYPPWSAEMETLPLKTAKLWIEMNCGSSILDLRI